MSRPTASSPIRGRNAASDQAQVLKAILAREAAGLPLNSAAVLRDDRGLHAQIRRLYGCWDRAMQAAGIDPERVRAHRRWSRKAVIQRLRERDMMGQPNNAREVQKSEPTLAGAAAHHFDSWPEALAAAGIDPSACRLRIPIWTKPRVVKRLQQIKADGGKLNHAASGRSSLSGAAVRLFGSWDAALRAAGIDPRPVRRYRPAWTADTLIRELKRKHAAGEALNARDVRPSHLRRPACRLFGSWDAALAAAGLDPARIRGNCKRG